MTLLIAALVMLVLMASGIILLLHLQTHEKLLQQRIAGVTTKGKPKRAAAKMLVRAQGHRARSPLGILCGLINYDPLRRDLYPLPWYGALCAGVILGRVVVFAADAVIGGPAWLVLPPVAIMTCRFIYGWADSKRRTLLLTQFPDSLYLIVRAVRVGIPVTESLRAVAQEAPEPTRAEFDRLTHQIAIGTALEPALREMAARNTLPEYGFFAAALALQAQTGGGLTETLETLADIIRKRLALKERGHALSSEARMSAKVLAILPVAAGGLIYLSTPDYIRLLFDDPTGHIFLGAGALSLVMGMGAMKLIINKSLS